MMSDETKLQKSRLGEPLKPAEPAEELLLPDIYAENDWSPKLALEDQPLDDDDGSEGFNPYDTAVLYKS